MTTPPSSPRYRLGIRFSLLARRWRRALDAHLAGNGLTDATWVPLVHLAETGGGIPQKALAALVGVDGSSLVRVLDIHVRDGLIERRPDPDDGRARLIHLTAAGTQRVAEIRAELARAEEELLADLSDTEIETMLAQFARIEARLEARQGTDRQETDRQETDR
ncbi:MarR family winged helix-turn-helix transcriptional regulator [Salipiger bermudensis]|uniref:MarR family winged helix-turn-helix transcriptional regulator n=1 Tax=Salipiger bermudensis TaxID=344736 RepID=UPI001CD4FBC4|nr:MarR family transcriptional regulator [Salipiger bermudensis]MCA1287960.1 MarR family transcriptional regulator [Salipiger bermudensis]